MIFKPMLADNKSIHTCFDKLAFPCLASFKVDGIRAYVRNCIVTARSGDPIRNEGIQAKFHHLEGADFELGVGDPTSSSLCRDTASIVNSKDKSVADVRGYAFDFVQDKMLDEPYVARLQRLQVLLKTSDRKKEIIEVLKQVPCRNLNELLMYEDEALNLGYEGLIVRSPTAKYKCGRSTVKEGFLLKLKRFTDGEFEVVGFEERMHNGNKKTKDALGKSKRSSAKANKSGRGDLGSILLKFGETTFSCGAGWSDQERAEIWRNQDAYLGRLAKIKYFAKGMKDVPRHPTFLAWRDPSDLS